MGRLQLASRNVAAGIANNVIVLVLGFVSRAVFIQVLGADVLGVDAVFISMIQMLSLAELGLTNVMVFSYYNPLARGDKRKLAALVKYYRKIYLAIAAIVFGAGMALIPVIPFVINVEQSIPHLVLAYALYVSDVALSYLFVYKATILRADQRGYIITGYEMVSNVLRTLVQIAILLTTGSYVLYVLVMLVFTLATNFVSARRANRDYGFINENPEDLSDKEKSDVLDTIKSGFIYKVSAVLLNSSTNIIISILVSTLVVGYLANYTTIVVAVTSIIVIIFQNLTASVGNLVITEKEEARRGAFNCMLLVGGWLTIVFVTCTFLLSNSFIVLWLGEEYVLPDSTVALKMALMFMSCIMQPIFSYREAVGLYRKTRYVMLAAALLNVAMAIALGALWGLDGILLASILSCAFTYFWYEPKVLYRDYFASGCGGYFKRVAEALVAVSALGFLGFVALAQIPQPSWGFWLVEAAAVFLVSNFVCWLIYRRRQEYREVCAAVKAILTRKSGESLD